MAAKLRKWREAMKIKKKRQRWTKSFVCAIEVI